MQLVLCTAPDIACARGIAQLLVERRLAACVNLVRGLRSIYRWNDEVQQADEVLLLIKSTPDRFDEICKVVKERHPFDVPEIISTNVDRALPAYLNWVNESCARL